MGKDVATALGYSNTRDALSKHVDNDDKTTVAICDTGSNYKSQAVVINESGLYALVLSSKLEQAKAFKRWVTSEVLPQIRKTGGYIPTHDGEGRQLTDLEIMALALQIQQKTLEGFARLPEEFTNEDVMRCFNLSSEGAARMKINRLYAEASMMPPHRIRAIRKL